MGTYVRLMIGLVIGLAIGFLVASWWNDPPRGQRMGEAAAPSFGRFVGAVV